MITPNFSYGNFTWWIGVVEDVKDPEMVGRLKVKIYGYYDNLSKDELPWAMVMGPIQSASSKGVGYSPTGILEGTTVVGFFVDGEAGQMPLVIGTLYGIPGENDVASLAREELKGKKNSWSGGPFNHPGTTYDAKYPECHTITTENGVTLELDSTKGKERFAWEHPSGTWQEATFDGDNITHVKKDSYTGVEGKSTHMTKGNSEIWVGGNAVIHIDGNVELRVKGNYDATVQGNYNLNVSGTRTITVGGTTTETSGGNHIVTAPEIHLN